MLEIKNLCVEDVGSGKKILDDVNLRMEKGKVYVLMGKNGSGKSTLANAIAGNPRFEVSSGRITLGKDEITRLSPDERAKKGIFTSFQNPVEVPGVLISSFLRNAYNSMNGKKLSFLEFQGLLEEKARILGIDKKHLERYINEGFSGGEKKKFEAMQALVLNPKIAIFDEIDSGLDSDAMKKISLEIRRFSGKDKTVLIITHYRKILDHLKPDGVFVMDNGKIVLHGGAELSEKIERQGYKWIKEQEKTKPRIFESEVLVAENATPNVKHLRFSVPRDFEFIPGQYLSLSVPYQGKKYRSPFSIATFPNNRGHADFFVKLRKDGRTSMFVESLDKGDKIELFGPLGRFTINSTSKDKDIVFVSSGTGITAFMSMLQSLFSDGFKRDAILLKGFRNEDEVLYENESEKMAKEHENFKFHNILSQPKDKNLADKGHVQDFFEKYVPKDFKGHFYICGLKEMVDDSRKKLLAMGFNEESIFLEKYN